jgi:hypothetical protein
MIQRIGSMRKKSVYSISSLNYHMKILLGDFSIKIGRRDIFKLTMGNKSSHEISNDSNID